MRKHNPENERIKRKYLTFLEHAKRQNVATIDGVAKALLRFEEYTRYKNFKAFHFEQAVGFKKHLAKQTSEKTGKPLTKSTLNSTLNQLKAFFQWLSQQPGFVSKLTYTDMEYFNLSEKETRIATSKRVKPVATVDQIIHVLKSMPHDTEVWRNFFREHVLGADLAHGGTNSGPLGDRFGRYSDRKVPVKS